MKKIIEIESCRVCTHSEIKNGKCFCRKLEKYVSRFGVNIPNGCPLEDAACSKCGVTVHIQNCCEEDYKFPLYLESEEGIKARD